MNTDTYKKIIIIQTAFIGDLILTTPLIRTIRSRFPESQIDIVVIPQSIVPLGREDEHPEEPPGLIRGRDGRNVLVMDVPSADQGEPGGE